MKTRKNYSSQVYSSKGMNLFIKATETEKSTSPGINKRSMKIFITKVKENKVNYYLAYKLILIK